MSDRYEIISVLGTGATSTVYLARHLKLKTLRAIKCISKTRSMPSSIFSEASLVEGIRHPGIPIVYDLLEDNSYIYIIEEYISGESLEHILLQQESISQEYIMQIGIQICQILSFLHNLKPNPILYQDLKPSHIIVCGNQVKIIDFGIASYITSQGKNFQKYGTIGYAPPEQYTNSALMIQSDIYGLGKVFEQFYRQYRHQCSKAFRYIIWKSTKSNPSKRYASAEALEAALRAALHKKERVDEYRQSYLLEEISIVGANPGAGVTHIAIALTAYLNSTKHRAVYVEENSTEVLEGILHTSSRACWQNHELCYGSFRGRASLEEAVAEQSQEIRISDYGDNRQLALLEKADLMILVINLSVWQREAALKAYEQVKHAEHLIVLCNYDNRHEAKEFAATIGQSVFCYPLERNPFGKSKEKRALFTQMLKRGEKE